MKCLQRLIAAAVCPGPRVSHPQRVRMATVTHISRAFLLFGPLRLGQPRSIIASHGVTFVWLMTMIAVQLHAETSGTNTPPPEIRTPAAPHTPRINGPGVF